MILIGILCFTLAGLTTAQCPAWGYECKEKRCVRVRLTEDNLQKAVDLAVCRILCSDDIGTLWPKPSGPVKFKRDLVHIDIDDTEFKLPSTNADLWEENRKRFLSQITAKVPDPNHLQRMGKTLTITISVDTDVKELTMETDESYRLVLSQGDEAFAEIRAKTYFGARHGLETLSQLIVYNDVLDEVQIVAEAEIDDAPAYKHRGIMLDTSRNYFRPASIRRTIDAMAMVKLNVFHWHITDAHSFPLVLKSQPDFAKYGAYSPHKVYTGQDVDDIVRYALVRGVRVIPEFEAPHHVGEGWQKKGMIVCFNKQPWYKWCQEPPCGLLDPTVDELYNVLEDIFREMLELFKNPDVFHMGGNEAFPSCWNSSESIRNWMVSKGWGLEEKDFMKLWGYFQENALKRVDKVSTRKLPVILFMSALTEEPYLHEYLDKDRYIIQVWTMGSDTKIKDILKRGFRIIISNYDALFLDCGGGSWVNDGKYWCSPYITWQKVYNNQPKTIAGEYHSQVLGGEAAIWSETIDDTTLDSKLWPRSSALAERLWSNPTSSWRAAEPRLLMHRARLLENGIGAEPLQPEWCLQNEGECM